MFAPPATQACPHTRIEDVVFPDPLAFSASAWFHRGSRPLWREILMGHPHEALLVRWLESGIRLSDVFVPFRGTFKGRSYDTPSPPPRRFVNHPMCAEFAPFIFDQIIENMRASSVSYWGPVSGPPPRVVLPLQVEPEKPRLIEDGRYIDMWTREIPFSLKGIADALSWIEKDMPLWVMDEKAGYHHSLLHPSSREFFGFQFAGHYFVYNTSIFGWKLSAVLPSYLRSSGLFVSCTCLRYTVQNIHRR